MSIVLPKYQLKVPSETTRFRDLGKELRELGISIETALASFDYNGADPNLVVSRVAALEAWRSTLEARVTAIENDTKERGWVTRNATAFTLSSTTYKNLSPAFGSPEVKGGLQYTGGVNGGFVVPRAGRYHVNLSVMAQVSGGLLGAISTQPAPNYGELLVIHTAASVQSLAGLTLSETLTFAAGDIVRPFALAGSGAPLLNAAIGSFSVKRAS